ncbi:MAG: XrtA/PEP-CTERM system TPR-repeat protein PrsT [Halioglobus sp.]
MLRTFFILLFTVCLAGCSKDLTLEDYRGSAEAYISEADYDSARVELKNALQLNPSDGETRCLLGRLELETGNMLDAQKELERALSLGCEANTVLPMLAESFLALGEFDEVMALASPDLNGEAYGHLLSVQGVAALFEGQPELAQELVSLALERAPQSSHAQLAQARLEALNGNSALALEMIEAVLAAEPGNDEAWRLKGQAHWRALHLPDARDAFTQAIETARAPIADYVSRGLVNIQMDDYAAAKNDAAALADIAVHHPGSNYIGGLLLFRAGEYRDAITMLSLGEVAAPKYPLMLFYLAVAHVIDGDAKVAETYAKRFLKLSPDSVEGRRLLAVLFLQRGAVPEVEAVLRPVLDFNSNDLGALHIMANALLLDDRADLAMHTFDWIDKQLPDVELGELQITDGLFTSSLASSSKDVVQRSLAPLAKFPREDVLSVLAHLKANKRKDAVAAGESYKWRDLTGVAPHNVLGLIQVAVNNEKAARKMFNQALKREPGDPSANLNLAKLERKAKNVKKEREHYNAVLRAHPDHLPTMLALAVLEGREGRNGTMADRLREAMDIHPNALEPRLGLARYYIDRGRAQHVEGFFESLTGLQKHSEKVRSLRYEALLAQGKIDEAISMAREEYAYNPNSATMMALVTLYGDAKQPNLALEVLKGWLIMSPADNASRLAFAGRLETSDVEAANEQYRIVLERDADNIVALNNLAWNLRKDQPQQALTYVRQAKKLAPKRAAVLDTFAVIAHLNGEHESASVAIARALEQAPDNMSLRFHEAMINAGMGKSQTAMKSLRQLLRKKKADFPERKQAKALLDELRDKANPTG